MDWGEGEAKALHFEDAARLRTTHGAEPRRDPDGSVPWFRYTKGIARHTVYFEDARSLEQKIQTIASSGLERVVFWSLGRHDPALLGTLRRRWGSVGRHGEP
jgi:spore germination protein YaaH